MAYASAYFYGAELSGNRGVLRMNATHASRCCRVLVAYTPM